MSIRERIQDSILLLALDRPSGALLSLLAAVSASSRKRYPEGTASRKDPREKMRDGEAFQCFMGEEMPNICGVREYNVWFRGRMRRLEYVFYKWMRCTLSHEAILPGDIRIIDDPDSGSRQLSLINGIEISRGWFTDIANALMRVKENADEFGQGTPAIVPFVCGRNGTSLTVDLTPSV